MAGVTRQGLYVELENTVEGLVRTDTLCKGEPELTEGVRWRDPLTGRQWDLGQAVQVKALAVDVALGHVDFELLED